ncbi:glycosyltransferase family 4 protein [Paenibacillus sp. OV219]|uniref:glycosyltransferase family 4 protein n=1 Tax=Paenibacillus sp. OV219 TaxID=1884377 RepID=UPI0008B75D57|nr:glycosyltransferase family 4 protein [Paenibacillus sp. OV219]SEP13612.1 Glycosyltransferase involved in cell wall bisynthesis [Paenibacillus sp. OV219]
MRILLATYWAIPHVGGVWKYMLQLKERLEGMGHQVDMLGNSPDNTKIHMPGSNRELNKDTLRPLIMAKLNAARAPQIHSDHFVLHSEFERYYMELAAAYFDISQYDLIHTQDIFAARAFERVKAPRTALVAHVHGSVALELTMNYKLNPQLGVKEDDPAWRYFNGLEHYGANAGHVTVTANNWQKELLVQSFGVQADRISVFPYGLDIDAFTRKLKQGTTIQRPPGKKVIICPARLAFVKGIDVLIAALHLLKLRRQDWVCWIVGNGEKQEDLLRQTAELQLQQEVLFLGERDDIPGLLNNSDIFVHACIQDNQPFSVMEAQVAGLPTLVSSAGGLPEMVQHGVNGLISPVRDTVTLATQLEMLLENDALRRQLGHNARQWGAKQWSMNTMMSNVMRVYQTAIAKSKLP